MLTTARLVLAEMADTDLDDVAALLAGPAVMRYYPRARTRAEAQDWIDRNRRRYREHGYGLWTVRVAASGEFVGDCGLTHQQVDGSEELEVGYHVRTALQRRGLATEAAAAVKRYARDVLHAPCLTALIHPDNVPPQRVAERLGLPLERMGTSAGGVPVRVHAGVP